MKSAKSFSVVLVTVPSRKTAKRLAEVILRDHLAACVNIIPGLESHYWWQEKLDCGKEFLLMIKTKRGHLKALEKLVEREHPYDTPEFLALPLEAGSKRYLDWLSDSVA